MNTAPINENELTSVLGEQLQVDPTSLKLRRIRSNSLNTTWYVDGWSRPLVLKVAPPEIPDSLLYFEKRMILQEPGILKSVKEKSGIPVPEIISLTERDGRIHRDWMLMTRLPGSPLPHTALSVECLKRAMTETGRFLSGLHRIHGDQFGYLGQHAPMDPQSEWPRAFTIMWNALVSDIEKSGAYTKDESASMQRLVESFQSALPQLENSTLLHMNVWSENLLVKPGGSVSGIVDWARALWGDPMLDLAACELFGTLTTEFLHGYGNSESLPACHPGSDVFRLYLLYELQKNVFIYAVRHGDLETAEIYKMRCFSMARSMFG